MTRVSSEHGFAMTRMGQIYLGGMTVKKEMYVMSSGKIERDKKNDSRSWMR